MSISKVMALWQEGVWTDTEVSQWADQQFCIQPDDAYLLELVLYGPKHCIVLPEFQFPRPERLGFQQCFALRLVKLNPDDRCQRMAFIRWAIKHAMGDDLALPEVKLSYLLDHYLEAFEDCSEAEKLLIQQYDQLYAASRMFVDEFTQDLDQATK